MGWFNNRMTTERATNSVQMIGVMASLANSKMQLETINAFVGNQRERAEGLAGQAFSVQGAGSSLGRQLQSSINDLGACLTATSEANADLDDRINAFNFVISQFETPRAARVINASGRQLTSAVDEVAEDAAQQIDVMKRQHAAPVYNAIRTIDQADLQLNGSNSTVASNDMPRLN